MKSLKSISLDISEEEYRSMPELSYSILARYERSGFDGIKNLFDKVESPSLLFGSLVDTLITGSSEEFDSRFFVCDFPDVPDSVITIVKALYEAYSDKFNDLNNIAVSDIIAMADFYKYQSNWKPETRAKVIREKGEEYYNLLFLAENKEIVSTKDYQDALDSYNTLKESETTRWYFQDDNPFDNIERFYQLKFNAIIDDIGYRCMFDEIIVDHEAKTIQPIDLKTSFKKEYNFYKSFVEWNYQIQNRLYFRILQENIKKDEYFKNFKILPYLDIVICRTSLDPMIWECPFTFEYGNLVFGKNKNIILRDPFTIAKELKYYLDSKDTVPLGINKGVPNDLVTWLNTL